MSVVVAVKKNGRAVIATDSMISCGDTLAIPPNHVVNRGKIIEVGKSIFGIVGAAATGNILRSIAARHRRLLKLDNAREIFETFRRLQKILTDEYHVYDDDDPEASFASSQIHALIVNQHGIFSLAADRTVIEMDRFWAIGCGSPMALGAMHAVYEHSEDPEAIARAGIHSACEFDLHCALPMKCHTVKLEASRRGSSTCGLRTKVCSPQRGVAAINGAIGKKSGNGFFRRSVTPNLPGC